MKPSIDKTIIDKSNAWPFVEAKKILRERKQYIEKSDIAAVTEALKKDKVTTGPYVKKFENKIKGRGSALLLAFRIFGIDPNAAEIRPSFWLD